MGLLGLLMIILKFSKDKEGLKGVLFWAGRLRADCGCSPLF
jgi:hypothetical protein